MLENQKADGSRIMLSYLLKKNWIKKEEHEKQISWKQDRIESVEKENEELRKRMIALAKKSQELRMENKDLKQRLEQKG